MAAVDRVLRVSLLLLVLVGEATGFFVSPIRQLTTAARQRFDESLYFAIAPSPFALCQNFETSAFLPNRAKEMTVTMVWPASQQQYVETNLMDTTWALGELAGFKVITAISTERGFKVVAKGSLVALRHFTQRAAVRNLAAQQIEWGS